MIKGQMRNSVRIMILFSMMVISLTSCAPSTSETNKSELRERISINQDWRFYKYPSDTEADSLIYDVRPVISNPDDTKEADSKPTEALAVENIQGVLKPWILPSGNDFIKDPKNKHARPNGNPGKDFPFVQGAFNDSAWNLVRLPHDWAIEGPFQAGWDAEVGGGMGRLPSNGVAWYRKKLIIPESDKGKSIFLDVDGAMSYAMVWLNGHLVGGWPYGYNSWRVDLTPYIVTGGENQLAIRLDNPNHSARWYPGGGLYRNVWLTKTNPVHIAHWGTFVTSNDVSKLAATLNMDVSIDNDSKSEVEISVVTHLFKLNDENNKAGEAVASFPELNTKIRAGVRTKLSSKVVLKHPDLWGPYPTQKAKRYIAITTILHKGEPIDQYETRFGIRSLKFDPEKGILINGEAIRLQGVNQHHDLGALGAAFNTRAAERQLEILREMGCNAIRMSHNPPAPELLELTDKMGFLVINEIFDSWERKKTPHDFHLIFPEWHEPDARALIRRDRNCPSVILWSFGNEVGEQFTGPAGAAIAQRLKAIFKEEDPSRLTTTAMNWSKPEMELPKVAEVINLNYQGEGIRQSAEFEGTDRIRTAPQYDAFHEKFPNKVIISSETASAFSSRGIYSFPVSKENSSPTRDGRGGDSKIKQVSSYELYAVDFGSSADKVFASLEKHPFSAGEFVWTGWDYIGEPTPYYEARSSYTGIIDLAGFRKDRFYLYQSQWRPDLPMIHILPHWNWPERKGKVTPVHVFTSGDEAELFLNGQSLGKRKKEKYAYRLRWDAVVYEPGILKAVAYKNGDFWAEEMVKTTAEASLLKVSADRYNIKADGKDLSFITVEICDDEGLMVPLSNNLIEFDIEGPGEIVATDNGDPTNMTSFSSHERNAFNGLALVIVRSINEKSGTIIVNVKSKGIDTTQIQLKSSKNTKH